MQLLTLVQLAVAGACGIFTSLGVALLLTVSPYGEHTRTEWIYRPQGGNAC